MPQDPLPGPAFDGEEPDGPLPPAGSGNERPGDDPDAGAGPEQGLFVCLPAEDLDVGRFAQDGISDVMPPGPLLASVVHALTGDDGAGLAALSDDQLMGIISAAQRMESRAAWTLMAAVREFASRRPAGPTPETRPRARCSEFAADELADELHLTWQSAAGQISYARAVADRLPRTLAALAAGLVHPVHVRIIEDETSVLSDQDAAKADEVLSDRAGSLTFGQLRSYAHRLILQLDPEAARKRKAAAGRDAHVRRFREDSGNAGMVARELPPDEVLASWQHVEQRALDLRAAGAPGTLQELRVRAYLDLLQERDCRHAPAGPDPSRSGGTGRAGSAGVTAKPAGNGGVPVPQDRNGVRGASGLKISGDPDYPEDPNGPGGPEPGPTGGPGLAALVTITVPLAALQGDPAAPGEAAGFGLLDAEDARDLVAAAARHPRTRWCVTAVAPDGTAAAHDCASGQLYWRAGQQATEFLRSMKITLNPVIRGPCHHAQAERRYRPGRNLRHLVNARNTRCTAPGCGQPAARCDLDHTNPWHHGGPTCPCNLAPLCRHHHRCKQAEGWWLDQPEPGVLRWRTPSGRTYATTPTVYEV